MRNATRIVLFMSLSLTLLACDEGASPEASGSAGGGRELSVGKADSSLVATFVDMSFSGEAVVSGCWNTERYIEDQLLYTIGQLNGDKSVGRLDKLELTNVQTESLSEGCKVTYDAKMLVAWGKKNDVPETYDFIMPYNVTYEGKNAFTEAYSHSCVDYGAHDVTAGSMWYYYRPHRYNCSLKDEDVRRFEAAVTPSPVETTGKYPEYHKVWEDEVFKVVAVFGKYEDGATTASDSGIAAYNRFVTAIGNELRDAATLETVPAEVPKNPGVDHPDISWSASLADGKRVEVVALMVDNVRTAGADFDERYNSLSADADLIVYNGHAGLGANIRALAQKGEWKQGQYAMVFINGCDTYAYVDSALADAHMHVNPDDDPKGTKYLDIITNAMPSFFRSMSDATMALVRGMLNYDEPRTFEQIFAQVDSAQVILVSGEDDNVYVPGYGEEPEEPVDPEPEAWEGLLESGRVAAEEETHFSTPVLPAGEYRFDLTGTGDADLYVRLGEAPSESLYDCRPYRWGSAESCKVEITTPTTIHVMVRGWDDESEFDLEGAAIE